MLIHSRALGALACLAAMLGCAHRAHTPAPPAPFVEPALDGRIDAGEWQNARAIALGDGQAFVLQRDNKVFVAIDATYPGIASLLVSSKDKLWVLHASAALGTARYRRADENRWQLDQGFQFTARTPSERRAFFDAHGWAANVTAPPGGDREFAIDLSKLAASRAGTWRIVVTFARMDADPPHILAWPPVTDDAVHHDLLMGAAPATLAIDLHPWAALNAVPPGS